MPNPYTLTGDQRRRLKQQAHHLKPVVLLGAAGFTEAVLVEIELALDHHELIKVRLSAEDRTARDGQAATIAARTGAALVQRIGHVASFYRANPRLATAPPPAGATPPGEGPRRRPTSAGDGPTPVGLPVGIDTGRRPRPAATRPAPVGLVVRRGDGRGRVRADGARADGFRSSGGQGDGPRRAAPASGRGVGPRPGGPRTGARGGPGRGARRPRS